MEADLKKWCKDFEGHTTFEVLYEDELEEIGEYEFIQKNLQWVRDWAQEAVSSAECDTPNRIEEEHWKTK